MFVAEKADADRSRRPQFRPLRLLALLLMVALAVVTAMVLARVAMRELGLETDTWNRGYAVMQIDKITDVTIFGLGVVFVVWFHRARINAEHRGWAQRRAPAWAFWGWVLPIANLFVPFQLMGDIWRAGLPAARRHKTAWLPALWWTTWLFAGFGQRHPWPHLSGDTSTLSMCMLVISAITLIAIICVVSDGPVGSPHPGQLPAQPAAIAC